MKISKKLHSHFSNFFLFCSLCLLCKISSFGNKRSPFRSDKRMIYEALSTEIGRNVAEEAVCTFTDVRQLDTHTSYKLKRNSGAPQNPYVLRGEQRLIVNNGNKKKIIPAFVEL